MSEDGVWRNGLAPTLRVSRGGVERTLLLRQTAPGAYAGKVTLGTPGPTPFAFELAAGGGITREAAQKAGIRRLHYSYPDEYRSTPPDTMLLRALAERTGGKFAPSSAEIFCASASA